MIQARGPEAVIATILVPTDFSPCSREALTYAAALAKRLNAIENEVYQMVNRPFNLNSPAQLADVLFGQLQLKAPGERKTDDRIRHVEAFLHHGAHVGVGAEKEERLDQEAGRHHLDPRQLHHLHVTLHRVAAHGDTPLRAAVGESPEGNPR